ncbi:MAG: hypothetical protein HY698_16080 [Deltaproteobacteria bacterium]|nr:hypothetical protein [Deltaproteobacteria bacterium]
MRHGVRCSVLPIVTVLALACARPPSHVAWGGGAPLSPGDLDEAAESLRVAVGAHPRDGAALLALGKIELLRGHPGSAFRALDRAVNLGYKPAFKELAELLVKRSMARAELGHRGARKDAERAIALHPAGRETWVAMLERTGEGGRVPTRPPKSCGDAWRDIGTPTCVSALREAAAHALDAPPSPLLLDLLAEAAPVSPETLAELVCLDLAAWLWGNSESWPHPVLAARLHEAPTHESPAWLRPTMARLRGNETPEIGDVNLQDEPAAHRLIVATERALAGDFGAAGEIADAETSAVFAVLRAAIARLSRDHHAEAVALGEISALLGAVGDSSPASWLLLARQGHGTLPDGILTRYRDAVLLVPESAREVLFGLVSPGAASPVAASPLRGLTELLRWSDRPGCRPAADRAKALERLVRAARLDMALAERLAQEHVDGDLSTHCRGFEVIAFFRGRGDVQRALALAETLLAEEPTDERALRQAHELSVLAGDLPKAALYLQQAEYFATLRGAPSLAAARVYLAEGFPVEAIAAARQALALGNAAHRLAAYELMVISATLARREADAARALTAYLGELPDPVREDARARIRTELSRLGLAKDQEAAVLERRERDKARLARELAWRPWDLNAIAQMASLSLPGSPERLELLGDLLFLAVAEKGARAAIALRALAALGKEEGWSELSLEARLLAPLAEVD